MRRVAVTLLICCASVGLQLAQAYCGPEAEPTIDGSPLSYWTGELASQDRKRVQSARQTLRDHPVEALAAIMVSKAQVDRDTSRRSLHRSLAELFEGAGTATPLLVSYLDCDRASVREMAIQLLGWIGPAAREAVPAVVASLADDDGGVRMQAGFTVARIGVVDAAVLDALRNTFSDDNWRAANAAAMALAGFWPHSRATFVEAIRGEPVRGRYYAMRGLKHVAQIDAGLVALLVERAERDVPSNRNLALKRLRGWDSALVAPYLERLTPLIEDETVRCEAARLLVGRSPPALEPLLLATFIELMQGPQTPRKDACHEQVHKDLPQLGDRSVEPLAALLRHPERHVRANALRAMSQIDPRPTAVYKHFLAVVDDVELRSLVGYQLSDAGADALLSLRSMLQHDESEVRAMAAEAAGRLGEIGRPLVPRLVERLPQESGLTRKRFIAALGVIGGEAAAAALPELRRAATDLETHAEAISALARILGPAAADLAPELIVALGEQSVGICPHPTADDDLRAIGPAAVPAIVEALAREDTMVRLLLLKLIDEWGETAVAEAVPVLERWVRQGEQYALDGAERLLQLGRLDPAAGEVVFEQALGSHNDWTRLRGAEGLVRLGGSSCPRGWEILREMAEHHHENVRKRASNALELTCP